MSISLISTVTVGAGGAASIDFTSIPGTYTDLLLVFSTRPGSTDTSWVQSLRFNGLTTNLSMRTLEGDGATATSGTNATRIDPINEGSNATANTFSNGQAYIPNYAGSTNKSVSIDSISETNATTAYQRLAAGLWSSTAAITQVSLIAPTTYAQYSSASLYGITKGSSGGVTVA